MKKKNLVVVSLIVIIGIIGLFMIFNTGEETEIVEENEVPIYGMVGTANPAYGYCSSLGYEHLDKPTDQGEVSYCIFPDGTECDDWKFYIGECGQKWSYCTLKGYDLGNSSDLEVWFEGVACIDKETKREVGRIYQLVNEARKRQLANEK